MSAHTEHHGRIELRWHEVDDKRFADHDYDDLEFDEFVIKEGTLCAHGERMSDGSYWIGLTDGDKIVHVNLFAKKKKCLLVTTIIEQSPDAYGSR